MTKIRFGCAALVMATAISVPAMAQVPGDKPVYFTFSAPVAIPQTTLPAGRYLFRLADSLTNRTIIQIYSADGSKLHAMLMTMPSVRPQVADEAEVRFLETAANQPPAIASYWYPGQKSGWEFIYPRSEAQRLAASSKTNVLTTAQETNADNMRNAELVRITPTGEQVAVSETSTSADGRTERGEVATNAPAMNRDASTTASSTAARQTSAPTVSAQNNTPSPAPAPANIPAASQTTASAQPAQGQRRALPATASQLPTVLLVGLLAAGVAVAFRVRRHA